jgi:hypothetical protein
MFNKFDGPPPRDTDQYSNVHDQTQTGSSNIATDTEGDQEHNLDAYTKISGEGARWQCVRAHAAKLQNDSRFFTAGDTKDSVLTITFVQLWLNWVGAFGPRYDIPDVDVVKATKGLIKGKGKPPPTAPLADLVIAVNGSTLTDKDYNLDSHASHTVK